MGDMIGARIVKADELFALDVIRNPFPVYQELRPRTPFATEEGAWVVMRHEDVFSVLTDHRAYSSDLRHLDNPVLQETPIIFEDPPMHTRHRRLVQPAFTNSRIAAMEPWISAIVDEALEAFGSGELDAVTGFCDPLPVKVIARLMGVPVKQHAQFKRWADERTFLVTGRGRPGSGQRADRWKQAEEANRQLLDYFLAQARARRASPVDDLISDVVGTTRAGYAISDEKVAAMCALLLTAGNVTTTHLLANMFALLADNPDWYRRAREDRSLVPNVVEEVLRLESPVQWLYRRTTRPTSLRGARIPGGASVIVYFGAANRDPEAYTDPDLFDPGSLPSRHAAFGHGIHFCLGAPLARLEASVALNGVLNRFSMLSRVPERARRAIRSATQFGYEYLPMTFHV